MVPFPRIRDFCFGEGLDHKITAGIEYFHDIQAGIVMAQETNTDWKICKKSRKKSQLQQRAINFSFGIFFLLSS